MWGGDLRLHEIIFWLITIQLCFLVKWFPYIYFLLVISHYKWFFTKLFVSFHYMNISPSMSYSCVMLFAYIDDN